MNQLQLKRDARKLFKQLIKAGLLTSVVYTQIMDDPIYDTVKGEEVVQVKTLDIDAYISGYSRHETSDDVLITDSRAVVLTEDFTLKTQINDIVEYDGDSYTVISFINNPNRPSIELQLRSA